MNCKKHADLSCISWQLDNIVWGHYLNFRDAKIPLNELRLKEKTKKQILSNLKFFNCQDYLIDKNSLTLTDNTEKIDERFRNHLLAELVKIIKPNNYFGGENLKCFFGRYISHDFYSENELGQLKKLTEDIFSVGKTYLNPNMNDFVLLLHIKYTILRLSDSEERHSLCNLISDILNERLHSGDVITFYFRNSNSMAAFFNYLNRCGLPALAYSIGRGIYLSEEYFRNKNVLLLYLAPLIDFGPSKLFNSFFFYSSIRYFYPSINLSNFANRYAPLIMKLLLATAD